MTAPFKKNNGPCRWRPALEPFAFVGLALCYIWLIQPVKNDWLRVPFITVTILIPILSNVRHRDSRVEMGLRFDNFGRSAREVAPATLLAAATVCLIGYLGRGSLALPGEALGRLATYPLWGLAQQYAMQSFVYRRCRESTRSAPLAALLAALLFAVVHWPNKALTLMTLIGGFIWCRLFERHPNLFTLALSHGIIAVLLFYLFPEDWIRNLRIGPGFYRWP